MKRARAGILIGGACFALMAGAGRSAESAREFPVTVSLPPLPQAMVTHCFECHDSLSAEAELDLESLEEKPQNVYTLARALESMRLLVESGDMPPARAGSQPTEPERSAIVGWIAGQLDHLAAVFEDDPGVVLMSRLTKYEYRNVIRDLSGGVVTDAGKFLPNEGGAGEGFANVGEAQGMNTPQLEKYLEAARGALAHLTVTPHDGFTWSPIPHDVTDDPKDARFQLVNEIIAWHVAQQQKWGEEHRDHLEERLGFVHAAYLEAAWRFRHRAEQGKPDAELASFALCDEVPLSRRSLEKWWDILNDDDPGSPFADWAAAWRALPGPDQLDAKKLRAECIAIASGQRGGSLEERREDFAPPYEISFHEAKEEVLEAAEKEGHWPFRIDIGDARELFLVCTDAGDGGRGEYAVWRRGRFVFRDGSSKSWQEAVTVLGANSGRDFPWGIDGEGSKNLPPDSIGVKPPGALKFVVPENAMVFEVDLTLDENRTEKASIQALVLREKPKSQSYVPGRYVFGGKKRAADAGQDENKERNRLLRVRNVAEANRTKIGLNAERNVFARWERSPLEHLGGPWPEQDADEAKPRAPYHYTVDEVLANATDEDLFELRRLEDRLASIVQSPQQELLAFAVERGWETGREGVLPPESLAQEWEKADRHRFEKLRERMEREEESLADRAGPWIEQFAHRAWRRSIDDGDRALLSGLYRESRARGYSFDGAVKSALMLVLVSPDFLYRGTGVAASGEAVASVAPLTGHELASRLSFFLWASLPDEELLALAATDRLRDPEVLREQARRLLRDPRAKSLATDFGSQFWGFGDFEQFTNPDPERFPEFDAGLRASMIGEVTAFLDDVFRNDRPLSRLLDSSTTFVNGPLARHYGIEGVDGEDFREIDLDGARRGGLAGMGLFLTKTSLPLRTSPVQRGNWLLESVLGVELPNPPADVPPLSEDDKNAAGENIREQLERHRADASCASCHDKIDPLGIALENFDPIGRWRERERDGGPLANVAETHDGVELKGMAGLKAYLLDRRAAVFAHFNRKLLGYALGRAVGPGDRRLLEEMKRALVTDEERFSALVELIVESPQFTRKRGFAPQREEEPQRISKGNRKQTF